MFFIGGVVILVGLLAGAIYLLANQTTSSEPTEQPSATITETTSEDFEALPPTPVKEVEDAINSNNKEGLEQYFPEEFRGRTDWSIAETIGNGTFVIGNTVDPDNAISRTYEAWTETDDGSVIKEFKLVFVCYGDYWLIEMFEEVNVD